MNPFILAGLVLTAVGLIQEARGEGGPQLLPGPPGPPGKDGKPGPKGDDGKTVKVEKKPAKVEKPSDG